jgi:hypothetical protein
MDVDRETAFGALKNADRSDRRRADSAPLARERTPKLSFWGENGVLRDLVTDRLVKRSRAPRSGCGSDHES